MSRNATKGRLVLFLSSVLVVELRVWGSSSIIQISQQAQGPLFFRLSSCLISKQLSIAPS